MWEEKLSYYDLMVMRVSEGEASFNSEEQNEPINRMTACSWRNGLTTTTRRSQLRRPGLRFLWVHRPSLGKTKRSDFSAIVTLPSTRAAGICMW